jgi:hypothetical protein
LNISSENVLAEEIMLEPLPPKDSLLSVKIPYNYETLLKFLANNLVDSTL